MPSIKLTNARPADDAIDNNSVRPCVTGILITLALSMLLSSLGTSIANVGLPTLAKAFGASFHEVEWVVLAYLLAITGLVVSVGRLSDIFGRRRLLLFGLTLFIVASAACGAASSLEWLVVARAFQGAGGAVMMTLAMAFVSETVGRERVGSAMGLLGTMSAVGTALAPSLGGFLIDGLGWPAMFWINVPIGLITMVFAFRFLPKETSCERADRPRFDIWGMLILTGSLVAYALSMTLGHRHGGVVHPLLLSMASVGILLFVFVESRVDSPLIRLGAFRNPTFTAGLLSNVLVATVIMTTFVVGPFYLSRSLGLSMAQVGLVMAVGPVISVLTGVLAGRLVDRFGSTPAALAGLAMLALGTGVLAELSVVAGIVGYVAGIAILTPGYQLFQAANNTAIMAEASTDQRGVLSGMLGLSRNLGLITGASVMGAVFSFAAGTADMSTANVGAVSGGMRFTFEVASLLMVLAIATIFACRWLARRSALAESEKSSIARS